MATVSVLFDDLDNKVKAAETVTFGLDGHTYEIDLSAKHASELRDALSKFVAKGRKVGKVPAKSSNDDAAAARQWARDNGLEISDKGRVPQDILTRYRESQNGAVKSGK
ncbi:MAG TPA: Lsr2 family protein [Gammaproteobacteria bacterium]|nr:Lsr2 family protein [Gammaproteobacteria bacterium]